MSDGRHDCACSELPFPRCYGRVDEPLTLCGPCVRAGHRVSQRPRDQAEAPSKYLTINDEEKAEAR